MSHNKTFILLEKLSEGCFGEVWKAIHCRTREVVAHKIQIDRYNKYPEAFKKEIEILSIATKKHFKGKL